MWVDSCRDLRHSLSQEPVNKIILQMYILVHDVFEGHKVTVFYLPVSYQLNQTSGGNALFVFLQNKEMQVNKIIPACLSQTKHRLCCNVFKTKGIIM